MKPQEWRQKLGDCVRYLFLSPEMGANLRAATGSVRAPEAQLLAAGSGQLPGVRGQAAHHGA